MSIICEQSTVNVSDVGYGGFENGVPKCAIGPVQMNNLQHIKNKTIFFDNWLSTGRQDAHLAESLNRT